MNNLLNFFIEVLFVTNLWIIIYTASIDYLNFLFPPVLKEQFFRIIAYPEPFEIPLYLLLTSVFVSLIYLLQRNAQAISKYLNFTNRHSRFVSLAKIVFLIALLTLFLSKLGPYPLLNDSSPLPLRFDKNVYYAFISIYLLTLVVISLEIFFLRSLLKNRSIASLVTYIVVTIFIALLTFEPKFPVSLGEYAYFLGPVWEISHGKTIYTNVQSQYGFIPILFFSLLNRLQMFPFSLIQILSWIFYVIEYMLSFYLILKITRSHAIAILGLFSIITLNYLPVGRTVQGGPFRWIPMIFVLFLFYKLKKIDSKLLIFFIALLSFWFIDSGIQLVLAYFFTLFILLISKDLTIRRCVFSLIFFFLCYLGILTFINFAHILVGMQPIDTAKIFFSVRKYALTGYAMLPIEFKNYFWLFMLIYFASIIYYFKKQTVNNRRSSILLFSANLSLFTSIYFVGRSHPHNLVATSIFSLLPFWFLVGQLYTKIPSLNTRIILLIFLFILLVVIPTYKREQYISETFLRRYEKLREGKIFTPEIDKIIHAKYDREVELIKNNLKEKAIVVVSTDETYLLALSKKENLLDINPLILIGMKSELMPVIQKVAVICPKKIAVDCMLYKKCQPYETLNQSDAGVLPQVLNEIENRCQIRYQPTICSNQLCIAEKVKN